MLTQNTLKESRVRRVRRIPVDSHELTHIVEEEKTVCLSWLPHHQKRSCRIDDLFSQPDLLPWFSEDAADVFFVIQVLPTSSAFPASSA